MTSPRPPTAFEVEVTAEQVAFFRENGFLGIERITTDEEVAWLGEVFDELYLQRTGLLDGVFDLARPYGSDGEPDLGQLLFPEQRVPELERDGDVAQRPPCGLPSARSRRGEPRELGAPHRQATEHTASRHRGTRTRPTGTRHSTTTHSAPGSRSTMPTRTTAACGSYPDPHRGEVLPHRHLNDDPNIHVLVTTAEIDTTPAVPVPLSAGGASFHHRRMIHYSGPNHSDRRRRAWSNEFQTEPVKREQPAERPWVDEGRQALEARFAERAPS